MSSLPKLLQRVVQTHEQVLMETSKFSLSSFASSWAPLAGSWELTLVSPSEGDRNGGVSYLYGTFNFLEMSPR